MRRAQGTGTITKIKNRDLRKPYHVRITERTWHDEQGKKHEKKKSLGYYSTLKEAQEVLENYNKNKDHINIEFKDINFIDLWNKWIETKETDNLSDKTIKSYKYALDKITDNIKNNKFVNINFDDLQNMINELRRQNKQYDALRKVKNSISQLYDYAIKCDITSKNYGKLLDIGHSKRKGEVLIFKDEEIKQIQKLLDEENEDTRLTAQIIFMLILNGCRISEFLNLKTEDIDLKNKMIKIKYAKTKAGDRRIPIHQAVLNIYQELYNEENEYFLINPRNNKKFSYENFRDSFFDRLRSLMNWNEELTPHNCRKTFSSLLKKNNVDPTYQKLLIGHEGALDLTEKTYTYISDEQLKEAINKIEINNM